MKEQIKDQRIGQRQPATAKTDKNTSSVLTSMVGLAVLFSGLSYAENTTSMNQIISGPPNAILASLETSNRLRQQGDPEPQNIYPDLLPQGTLNWQVDVKFVTGKIYNPSSQTNDVVRLRSYHQPLADHPVPTEYPFAAPTLNLTPGNTLRVKLNNMLDDNDTSCYDHNDVNVPHCFNSTNLHTHGLWISPAGNSDNVLLKINPNVSFDYEFNIPEEHPAGTFWYHPHLHGSTALQVSSGMAGAIIIRGNRYPKGDLAGDIDVILRKQNGEPMPERVMLLQQIQYACRDEKNGKIETQNGAADGKWICGYGQTGGINRYTGPNNSASQFGPSSWAQSGRYTTINGHVFPIFKGAKVGQVERWRLIHAGVRETIRPHIKTMVPIPGLNMDKLSSHLSEDEHKRLVEKACTGETIGQVAIAADGLTRRELHNQTIGTLQPGYREDLLMSFMKPGIYCLLDEAANKGETVSQAPEKSKLLAIIQVTGAKDLTALQPQDYTRAYLAKMADKYLLPLNASRIAKSIAEKGDISAFSPHKTVKETELTGSQTLGFNIDSTTSPTQFQVGKLTPSGEKRDMHAYKPDRIDRHLQLGGVEEWTLKSFVAGHPFHIHVNPFQIVKILNKQGEDVSQPNSHSQYAGLKGVWKDTLFVEDKDHTVVIRTRYQRFIGEYVLHCHILDHEDQGMMQNVMISLPDGKGGLANSGH